MLAAVRACQSSLRGGAVLSAHAEGAQRHGPQHRHRDMCHISPLGDPGPEAKKVATTGPPGLRTPVRPSLCLTSKEPKKDPSGPMVGLVRPDPRRDETSQAERSEDCWTGSQRWRGKRREEGRARRASKRKRLFDPDSFTHISVFDPLP